MLNKYFVNLKLILYINYIIILIIKRKACFIIFPLLSKSGVLKLQPTSGVSGRLVNMQMVGSHPQSFWFSKSRVRPMNGITNKSPSDADAGDQRFPFQTHS